MKAYLERYERGEYEAVHTEGDARPIRQHIALDMVLKYNLAGVGAFSIELPDAKADPALHFQGEEVIPSFVTYLRKAVANGGFLGNFPLHDGARRQITADLLPF